MQQFYTFLAKFFEEISVVYQAVGYSFYADFCKSMADIYNGIASMFV